MMIYPTSPIIVHVQVATHTDVWTVVAGIAALVAAVGAVGGLVFAYLTVRKASETLTAMNTAHAEEMTERQRALEAELTLHRIEQMQRVLEVTIELRDFAYNVQQTRDTEASRKRLVAARTKLKASLGALEALGGPRLADLLQLATDNEVPADERIASILEKAGEGIEGIAALFADDPSLKLRRD